MLTLTKLMDEASSSTNTSSRAEARTTPKTPRSLSKMFTADFWINSVFLEQLTQKKNMAICRDINSYKII